MTVCFGIPDRHLADSAFCSNDLTCAGKALDEDVERAGDEKNVLDVVGRKLHSLTGGLWLQAVLIVRQPLWFGQIIAGRMADASS